MKLELVEHDYCGKKVAAFLLTRKFLSDFSGDNTTDGFLQQMELHQSSGFALFEWIASAMQCSGWKSRVEFIFCSFPEERAESRGVHETVPFSASSGEKIHVHGGSDLCPEQDTAFVFVEMTRRKGKWLAILVGHCWSSSVSLGRFEDRQVVHWDCVFPNRKVDSLSDSELCELEASKMQSPILPAPGPNASCTAADLEKTTDSIFSFCLRWHCSNHSRTTEKAKKDALINANMYNATIRHFKGSSARVDLFGNEKTQAALSILTRLAKSNRLRAFVRQQMTSALQYICENELPFRGDSERLRFACEFFEAMASAQHCSAWPGDPDVSSLGIKVDDGSLSFSLFSLTAELNGLLLPEQVDRGVSVRRGRVYLTPDAAIRELPGVFRRYYEGIEPRTGDAAAKSLRVLKESGFDSDACYSKYESLLPVLGVYYASTREKGSSLDDPVLGTDQTKGLRLYEFSVPEAHGLCKSANELQEARERTHTVPTSDGPRPVPITALHTIMHRQDEARVHLVSNDSQGALRESMLAKSGALSRHSTLGEEEYAQDPDRATSRDNGFREWLAGYLVREKEGARSMELDSSAESLVSSSGSAPDIEDLIGNVYANKGMPLCVLAHAKKNMETSQHPKDASRMEYFPFLRSLELPGIGTRTILVHMMRNVPQEKFGEMFRRFSSTCPANCAATRQRSFEWLVRNGKSEDEANRSASCFQSCRTKQTNGSCPFANVGSEAAKTRLRAKLRDAGLDQCSSEVVVAAAARGKPGSACKQFFVETRPVFGARNNSERVPPFPPGQDFWINRPKDFTYLAAIHMEASLRSPPGYLEK